MKKNKSKLIVGILLLLAALAAGAYWAWSNPLFGRRLSLTDLNPSQTQADKETVDAEGGVQAASGASASAENASEPATDAEILKGYMAAVVSGGTGKRAAVSGLSVCGKTGSAESSLDGKAVSKTVTRYQQQDQRARQ